MPVTALTLTPMPPPLPYPAATIYPDIHTVPGPASLTLTPVQ